MLPFWVSIGALTIVQAVTVGIPAPDRMPWLARLRGRGWALVPAGSIIVVIVAIASVSKVAQGLTYLALVAVPLLAAAALGRLARFASPPLALLVVPLFALAWADRGGLAGEAAGVVLSALSCVTLGVALVAVAPRPALKVGVVGAAIVDTALVVSDLLQAPNGVLNAAHPAAGLPQLQRAVFGSALIGYGDLFIAAVVGAMLAFSAVRQRRAVVVAGVTGLLFDLLFFAVRTLPATVPIAVTLLVVDRRRSVRVPKAPSPAAQRA